MSETGHAPNLEKFQIEINACIGYSTRYNPSNPLIKIPALQTVSTDAQQSLLNINTQDAPRKTIINSRQALFQKLPNYVTRIILAFAASQDIDKRSVDDARTWGRKIHGERKSKKILNPTADDPKQISASQRSFVNQVEFFDKLISYILIHPTYTPNEPELQETALRAFESDLRAANDAAYQANIPWLNALSARDNIFYAPVTGLVDRALAVKKYVHSVQSITPEDYKQISGLEFRRPTKKK